MLGNMEIQYTQRLNKIEAVLHSWLPGTPDPSWLEKVFLLPGENINRSLVKALTLPGWDLLNRGGKRWRPLLMVLIAEALAGEKGAAAAIPLTPLVELAHNASLIHDDIEDSSDERRGKPAVHLIYGNDAAINSGAFLYFLPLACIAGTDFSDEAKLRIHETWGTYMARLHLGQAMDIAWHNENHFFPEIREYETMCRLKTGCLARLAAALGLYCAEYSLGTGRIDDNLAEDLKNGAEKLGLGFQILDDVKNLTTGNPGKKRGDDIVEGKKSLPILLYLHRRPEKQEFAARCFHAARSFGPEAPELEELIEALQMEGILEEALHKGKTLINESKEIFTGMASPDPKGRELLGGLLDFVSE